MFAAWFVRDPAVQVTEDSRGDFHTFSCSAVEKTSTNPLENLNGDTVAADAPEHVEVARAPVSAAPADSNPVALDARRSQNSQPWLDLPS